MIEDIPPGWDAEGARVPATDCPTRLDQYEALLDRNEIFAPAPEGHRHRVRGDAARSWA